MKSWLNKSLTMRFTRKTEMNDMQNKGGMLTSMQLPQWIPLSRSSNSKASISLNKDFVTLRQDHTVLGDSKTIEEEMRAAWGVAITTGTIEDEISKTEADRQEQVEENLTIGAISAMS